MFVSPFCLVIPLHRIVNCGVRLQVSLVKDTVFDTSKFFKSLDYGFVLAHVNSSRANFYIFNALVLVIQFFVFEVCYTRWPILKLTRVIDDILHLFACILQIVLEVSIMGHHLSYRLLAVLSVIFMNGNVIIGYGATIPGHLQLFINFVHYEFQTGERILVYHVLFEFLDHFRVELFICVVFLTATLLTRPWYSTLISNFIYYG